MIAAPALDSRRFRTIELPAYIGTRYDTDEVVGVGRDATLIADRELEAKAHIEESYSGLIKSEFDSLRDQWCREVGDLSSSTEIAAHPAYVQIIELGRDVLPFIMQELEARSDHWFVALAAITGENPVPTDDRGRVRRMAQAWLRWATENGIKY